MYVPVQWNYVYHYVVKAIHLQAVNIVLHLVNVGKAWMVVSSGIR